MAEFTLPKHGEICWRELATKDLATAMKFYSAIFGWTLEQTRMTSMDYKEIHMNDVACGGMMEIDEKGGAEPPPSFWINYIAVDNADAAVEKIIAHGGGVRVPPFDTAGVGRMAMVMDPAGASFSIIQFPTE